MLMRRIVPFLPFALPLAAYNVIVWPYVNFFPIWDARLYYDALLRAVQPFTLSGLAFFGHPSYLYGLLFAYGQYFWPGSVFALNFTTILIGNCAVVAFALLVKKLFATASVTERVFMALLFAVQPIYAANTVSFNLDFGVSAFMVIMLACLVYRQYWAMAAAGLMMIFTKEIGFLLYGSAAGLLGISLLFSKHRPPLKTALKTTAILTIPLVAFGLYSIAKIYLLGSLPVWSEGYEGWWEGQLLPMFLYVDVLHGWTKAALGTIFVLNFAWISVVGMAAATLYYVYRRFRDPQTAISGQTAYFIWLLVFSVYAVSRIIPVNSARYAMGAIPVVLIVFFFALRYVVRWQGARAAVLAVFCCLTASSLYHSNDPVSRLVYPTAPFGNEKAYMLRTFMLPDAPPWGRDELVYNLQYTNIGELFNKAMQAIQPQEGTAIISTEEAWLGFRERWDPTVQDRTVQVWGVTPWYGDVYDFDWLQDEYLPQTIYVMNYPVLPNTSITPLLDRYTITKRTVLNGTGGHYMVMVTLEKKAQAVAADVMPFATE